MIDCLSDVMLAGYYLLLFASVGLHGSGFLKTYVGHLCIPYLYHYYLYHF